MAKRETNLKKKNISLLNNNKINVFMRKEYNEKQHILQITYIEERKRELILKC